MREWRVGFAVFALLVVACGGEHWGPGTVTDVEASAEQIEARAEAQRTVEASLDSKSDGKQILFGDLHVHTTFSPDGMAIAMPIAGGEGAHPPADACDFARFCSALDFWSINDHAEGITPRRWAETRESIRQCNEVAGDPANPDLVSFLGWEWSQVALDPNKHYGHKNVVLLGTADDEVPTRAIAAPREQLGASPIGLTARLMMSLMDWENREVYQAVGTYFDEIAETPHCPQGVDARDLPDDCHETAADPQTLFEKLDQWDHEAIVIPHGNAWGLNTPPGTSFDKQLTPQHHDPDRQILFEIFSGHGNSEEYRDWRAVEIAEDGSRRCPEPSDDYLPCCWRAGQIIRERCEDPQSEVCERRVQTARQNHVDASVTGYWTVPGTTPEDWLGCGQCKDCYLATFDHRPMTSAQYALAISHRPESDEPLRYRYGLIGSSDNHRARPGTGYKELDRYGMTDVSGAKSERMARSRFQDDREPAPESVRYDHERAPLGLARLRHMDRQASFWLTGGLVAAHSEGRAREEIWDAFHRREVYATSGDRILLWFDWLAPDGTTRPMGSEIETDRNPRFVVRAAGAREQKPGCPRSSIEALGHERIESVCRNECFHPGETRKPIDRIEVVRIRPQIRAGEDVGALIQDPWLVLPCAGDIEGCRVDFFDPDYIREDREVLYYVRAIQPETPTVNAGGLRCKYDDDGNCIAVAPCYGDPRTDFADDCLSPAAERAWSSPIFLRKPS